MTIFLSSQKQNIFLKGVFKMKTTNQTNQTALNPMEEIKTLMEKRNALALALIVSDTVQDDFNIVVADLCDKLAFLSVKKALEFRQSNNQNLPSSALAKIDSLLSTIYFEYSVFKYWKLDETFGDNIPLYDIAYTTAYTFLNKPIQLNFDDIVFTKTLKNGREINRNLYQHIKQQVFDDIHNWSISATENYKTLHYVTGITDEGKQVTTSKRPQDDLTDIDETAKKQFCKKYNLTAREQETILLFIQKKTVQEIAIELNITDVTAYQTLDRAKKKFTTASAYEELCTARASEKAFKSRANKDGATATDILKYERAKDRTATAFEKWKAEFYKNLPQD